MFHCNGWCFPWTLAATAGVSVCLRHVQAGAIYEALHEHRVSHFCAAPIVLNMLNNADPALKLGLSHPIKAMTAGVATHVGLVTAVKPGKITVIDGNTLGNLPAGTRGVLERTWPESRALYYAYPSY